VATRLNVVGITDRQLLMSHAQLKRLAHASGGVVRDFVGLVYDSMRNAYGDNSPLPLTDAHIDNAIADTRRALSSRLTQEFKQELHSIHKTHLPSGSDVSIKLVHGMLALSYCNGSTWYDAHPLLWDSLA